MAEPVGDASFRSRWLELPVDLFLADEVPDGSPLAIEVCTGDEPMTIETVDGRVRARAGSVEDPDLVLGGPPQLVLGVLAGRLSLEEARGRGLRCDGDAMALTRVRRQPVAEAVS